MPNPKQPSMFLSGRAQKACQSCQIAKIRCNAVAGSPCQNCNRKGLKCVVNRKNRPRRRSSGQLSKPSPAVTSDSLSAISISPTPCSSDVAHMMSFSEEDFWNTFTNLGPSAPCTPAGFSPLALLPAFINPLPIMMSQDTVECLRLNGVLCLPSIRLQSALLQTFVETVLPSLPIIEWQGFLNSIHDGNGGHGSISLLLYLAVMFSATTFVDVEHLLEAGYSSRREAHEAFFQRTQLLYKANYETDPLVVVQSLLLMTYRLDTSDGHDSRHWMRAAITVARSIGLFQDVPGVFNVHYSASLWKRVAWACYITDCVISLRLRCRTTIERAEFRHQPLTEEDFELDALPFENQVLSPTCPIIRNVKVQRDLALVCISSARLCTCISDVLDLQGKQSIQNIRTSVTSTFPTASPSDDFSSRVFASEMELADWANTLPPPCQASPLDLHNMDEEPTVILHRNILHMIFYTTVAVFHQSQPFPSSKFCVQLAANQISRIMSELYQRDLQHRLPVVGVTAILIALIIHVAEMKAPSSEERDEALQNFQLCLDVMTSLRELYWEANTAAAWALRVIQSVAFKGGSEDHCRFRARASSSDSNITDPLSSAVPLMSIPPLKMN
ncbi:uncharacterized protein N7482_008490 [Penicillium canariense]|uniref:Zn(2)-C6 fungal-type domain-containing protein n=1 Tax=Penicillium canariense TaxID=189055 RepID=A0A9W9LJ17_9EURO|nr:uncharacterized protein N7482_008490 [Penicillium canariense]KAJ5157390.1 hypothetical protein N7482_008490 [Penicillium canariense]